LIIGGDWNDDTTTLEWQSLWTELGLTPLEALSGSASQATYVRGTKQLDTIYVSPLLAQAPGGFLSQADAVLGADHSALWLDIPNTILSLGTTLHTRPPARRLKTDHPAIRDAYLEKYKAFCAQHKLFSRSCTL